MTQRWGARLGTSVLAIALCLAVSPVAQAAVIFESAVLPDDGSGNYLLGGPPGLDQFLAVRFSLASTVTTAAVGGYIDGGFGESYFGAIVALSGPGDFPDSEDLSTADVLGVATIPGTLSPADSSGALVLVLPAGDYALVLGSGLFGTTAVGGMPFNMTNVGAPSYFFKGTTGSGVGYTDFGLNNRFFILDSTTAVPEPASLTLLGVGMLGLLGYARRYRTRRALGPVAE